MASGLSLGNEGPLVHIACSIGSIVAGRFAVFQDNQGNLPRYLLRLYYFTNASFSSHERDPVGSRGRRNISCFRRTVRRCFIQLVSTSSTLNKSKHIVNSAWVLREELSSFFPDTVLWQSFVCAIVAAVTLQYVDPYGTGR